MVRKRLDRSLMLAALAIVLVDLQATAAATEELVIDGTPAIANIASMPKGRTYGRWAVEWQQ